MAVEQQIVIGAPIERVFAYVSDFPRHSEWADPQHKLTLEAQSDGPVGQGAMYRSVGHQFGRNEDTVTVTEYVPNQRVVYQSEGKAGTIRHAFELAPVDGGTQLTKSFEPLTAKMPFSLFLPIVKSFILPGALKKDLARIKEKVEGQS